MYMVLQLARCMREARCFHVMLRVMRARSAQASALRYSSMHAMPPCRQRHSIQAYIYTAYGKAHRRAHASASQHSQPCARGAHAQRQRQRQQHAMSGGERGGVTAPRHASALCHDTQRARSGASWRFCCASSARGSDTHDERGARMACHASSAQRHAQAARQQKRAATWRTGRFVAVGAMPRHPTSALENAAQRVVARRRRRRQRVTPIVKAPPRLRHTMPTPRRTSSPSSPRGASRMMSRRTPPAVTPPPTSPSPTPFYLCCCQPARAIRHAARHAYTAERVILWIYGHSTALNASGALYRPTLSRSHIRNMQVAC